MNDRYQIVSTDANESPLRGSVSKRSWGPPGWLETE